MSAIVDTAALTASDAGAISLTVPLAQLQTTLLASVRVAAFLVVAPPFNAKGTPGTVKVALALAVGAAVTGRLTQQAPDTTAGYLLTLLGQAVIGLVLGFAVQLVLAAVQVAGSMLDQFGGFQMGAAFDPMSQNQHAQIGQLYSMLTVALLFASDGYQVVLDGLVRTFDAVPLGTFPSTSGIAEQLTGAFSGLVAGALQIAGPLVLVLFLTDVGLGLLTKVAPALNAFGMGFPLKILVTLVMVGFAVLALPHVVSNLAGDAVSLLGRLTGGQS